MSESEERDTERVSVKTYLPRYQKEEWVSHAEDLDMSQAEFVRTMVQAGRRVFEEDDAADRESTTADGAPETADGLSEQVRTLVEVNGPVSKGEIVAEFEDVVADVLEDLAAAGEIEYDIHADGFVTAGDN